MHVRRVWTLSTLVVSMSLLAGPSASHPDDPLQQPPLIPIRGMVSVTPQGNPSTYRDEISLLANLGVNVINTFHGSLANNELFLELADEAGIGCIPSIPLICWIRFGDPPYPASGPLGWDNLLEWLKLYGYQWPDVPEPFSQGPDGQKPLSDEQLGEQVRQTLEQMRANEHTSLVAFYAFDEPSANSPGVIDRLARVHSAFSTLGTAVAPGARPPTITGIFLWGDEGQSSARRYMTTVTGYGNPPAPEPPVLMYDCYVLAHAVGSGLTEYESYANQWVEIGREFGVPVIVVPQGFAVSARPAPNELRAQAYLALAAGCKGVNWFRFETLRSMGDDRLEEIAEIYHDLERIGPTLLRLSKVENAAVMSGCGGRYKAGTVNTFRHDADNKKYIFIVSKDVIDSGSANITVSLAEVGYPVERIVDCHDDHEVAFADDGGVLNLSYPLEPGQGRLLKLDGDPTVPISEIALALPLLLILVGAGTTPKCDGFL